MKKEARRHVMPANSIGFFSEVESGRRRDRRIYCKRKTGGKVFVTTPNNVGWLREVYGAGKGNWHDHDRFFGPFERFNTDGLKRVLNEQSLSKDSDLWMKLAAYCASRITRDPQDELQSAAFFAQWTAGASRGYPWNMMRLSAAVLRCRWEFIRSPQQEFILNDRGYAGLLHQAWEAPALLLPLRRDSAVMLGGGKRHKKQLAWRNGRWEIEIPTRVISAELTSILNALSWIGAREEGYAAKPELIELAAARHVSVPVEVERLAQAWEYVSEILGSTSEQDRNDEMLLYSLLPGIRVPQGEKDVRFLTV